MRRGVSFYILILLALAALGATVFFLAPGNTPDTPPVVLAPLPSADTSAGPPTDAPDSHIITVSPDTVQTVISTLSRADSYSRTLTVQSFWNGGSATKEIDVWAQGENLRLAIRDAEGSITRNVLLRGAEEWIWYSDAAAVWHGAAREGDADAYQTLLTYEEVLALDRRDILDAGYADYNDENCVYVRWRGGTLGYESVCWISDATGLLMGLETYDGDVLVYTMRSTPPDLTTPAESVFAVP